MHKTRRIIYSAAVCIVLGLAWLGYSQPQATAEDNSKYVGSETCAMCHVNVMSKWRMAVHRRTLFNKDPAKRGCEACHGPGGDHVAAGGDKTKILHLQSLKPEDAARMCQKCHTQEEVTLWPTSRHARAKLSCVVCHDPHSPGEKTLLADAENAKLAADGLARAVKQAQVAADIIPAGSPDRAAADEKVKTLRAEKEKLEKELKGAETAYHRIAEPYVCYNCHKAQQVQSRMPSHHPIVEGKMKCSSCHNPHGGPKNMLRKETTNETCRTCHAEKAGPFVFEHPAVTEDCMNCHSPHGSIQNKMLSQSQPFLCLKCHTDTHAAQGDKLRFAQRYTTCTNCHTDTHGSDTHKGLLN
jgi:predicted CXXCH cytochrome family protein